MDMKCERQTYLIPLEQVVRDFGSVVAWRLRADRRRERARETEEISLGLKKKNQI